MSLKSQPDAASEVEMTWGDLLNLFARRWIWIAGSTMIGIALAIIAIVVIKPQAEAEAVVRIGQIADMTTGANHQVEPITDVLERLRLPSYFAETLTKLTAVDEPEKRLLQKSFRSELLSPTLIRMKVRAYTPSEAHAFLKAAIDQLVQIHQARLDDALRVKSKLQQNLLIIMDESIRTRDELTRRLTPDDPSTTSENAIEKAILLQTLVQLSSNIRDIEQRKFLMDERVKSNSSPTELFDQIAVTNIGSPIGVRTTIIGGLMAGLILGLICAILIDYVARSSSFRRVSTLDRARGRLT